MAFPDPKSFDTLEKAQAEIARLQTLISQFCDKAARVLAELP